MTDEETRQELPFSKGGGGEPRVFQSCQEGIEGVVRYILLKCEIIVYCQKLITPLILEVSSGVLILYTIYQKTG
jgi:hypothetical protein